MIEQNPINNSNPVDSLPDRAQITDQKEYKRHYLSDNINLNNWQEVEKVYRELADRPISSPAELEKWLLDRSEFEAALSEAKARLYVAHTCHTEDQSKEEAYLRFEREIEEPGRQWNHKLNLKYVNSSHRTGLDQDRYRVLDRSIASAVRLYRDENVPLLTRDTELSADYDKITGAMTVSIDGKELTLEEAAALLREPDRQRRQDAWEKIYNRWHQDHDRLDELYDEMVQLRDRIAKNAGFSNFRDYTFEAMERFDYTPRDCEKLHQAVEEVVVPLARELVEARKKALGVDKVRPWDMHVDPENRPALKPYNGAKELVAKVIEAMRRIDPEFADFAQEMADREDLDLSSRPGKSGGGYMETFDEVRRPFIFMNEVGTHDDAMTLAHELGHSFHALLARNDPIVEYRHAPLEFSEVASMGSEQFMLSVLDVFYSEEDKKRAVADSFEDIILFLPYCMQVDAFQHWVYLNPEASSAERDNEWHKLGERFGTGVDWSGYEQLEESGWHYKLHIFTMPFYYFEYAVAQLGALQLRENFKNDPDKTIAEYRRGLSLGGSRPLPELFEAAGIKFDFSEDMLRHLIDGLRKELINLGRLPADR